MMRAVALTCALALAIPGSFALAQQDAPPPEVSPSPEAPPAVTEPSAPEEGSATEEQDLFEQLERAVNQERRARTSSESPEAADTPAAEAPEASPGPRLADLEMDEEGFATLPTGLKIKVVEEGDGPAIKAGDRVWVHYVGRLPNGELFDTSLVRRPFELVVGQGQVIKGWDQGLQWLRGGSEAELIVPPDLGYGPRGQGPIPPNSTLHFRVKVMGVNQPDFPAAEAYAAQRLEAEPDLAGPDPQVAQEQRYRRGVFMFVGFLVGIGGLLALLAWFIWRPRSENLG